ncbi:MAG: glycoside hydrolase family 15 protein [Clostridia bacterium]|nr:glycoside hydrolase family 15 protein [Clostridia bacterium]
MDNKYLNEAIIGNKQMLATFTSKGELQRLYFPSKDNRQYINFFHTGVKINNSDLIYLHDDVNNVYKQYYDTDTNVLNTEVTNTYFSLKMVQTDYVLIKENVLVKKYIFLNDGKIDLDTKFFIHSELLSDRNNLVSCKVIDEGMLQYAHDFSVSTFAKGHKVSSHQINGSKETINRGEIKDKDYIGMSKDSSICYDLGIIKPQEKKILEICVLVDDNRNVSAMEDEVDRITKIDLNKEYNETKSYWRKYVKSHNGLNLKEPKNSYEEKVFEIYKRSILLFPLLTNTETGGMIAATEVDEDFTNCGRYAYCWPRDAVFITKAMDILKMDKETEKFYKVFCKKTQSKNGMWEQRFFTDGKLAPCWGYQIDETASVVFGVYEHYKYTKSEKFLKDNLKMCEKAIDFLKKYVKDWLGIEGKEERDKDRVQEEIENSVNRKGHKYHVSYDLWEMHEGIHLYSIASIYSAFDCILKIYRSLGKNVSEFENNRLKEEKVQKNEREIEKIQTEIKKYINKNLYDEERKTYLRNTEDKKMDISILGAVTPFKVFKPKEKKILNTIENINMRIRTYTGGYQRFEEDHYMNGNPWPIANLWMTLYYLETGEKKKAKEAFDFVVKTAGKHYFLGEQIDNSILKPNWVIGLGWSHAMFVIVLEKLYG